MCAGLVGWSVLAQQAGTAGLQGVECSPGLQASSLWAEVRGTLLGSRSTKGLHRPHGTRPPSAWSGPQEASPPSSSLGKAQGKRPAPPRGSRHGVAKPQNGPLGRPGGPGARGPGRLGQGHPEFLARRSRPAPPPLPGPPRPRASAAPAPCQPPAPRQARPGPRLQSRVPQARGAPRASPRPPPAAWNPTGRHPRRGRPTSHPQLSAARSPEPDPTARAPYRPTPRALRKTRKWIAIPEPRGGKRQSPERIRARFLAGLWGSPKGRATPG